MSLPRLRALGVLAATSALAVAALGAPAGASAAIGTGKVDVAVDQLNPTGFAPPTPAYPKTRAVRDVDATIYTVGVGRIITKVNVNLLDTKLDLNGPCYPSPKFSFYDQQGSQYLVADSSAGWLSYPGFGCAKSFTPDVGPPLVVNAGPEVFAPRLAFTAKPGKVCATIGTPVGLASALGGTITHVSRPVCATIL
jgi:hypothetical protein